MRILEFRIRDVLNLDHTRLEIYDALEIVDELLDEYGRRFCPFGVVED